MLAGLLAEAVRRFGDRPAYVGVGRSVTYAELEVLVRETAAGLAARGVGQGDVVALTLPNGPDYVACYLGAARIGAVTAGISTRLAAPEQRRLLELAQPALVVTPEVIEDLRRPAPAVPMVEPDPDRPVAVVFTSGTTGTPKGAVFAERQLAAVREVDIGDVWGAGGSSLFATSMTHMGFMTKIAAALQAGGTAHLVERWDADEALRLASSLRLTSLAGVPTQFALMLASATIDEVDLSSVRGILIGGGPATPELVRRIRARFGVPLVVRYSCTEAGIGCGTLPGDPPEDAEETVGRPLRGVELAIRDDAGADQPQGTVGEVLLRSAAVMSGYHGDAAATAATLTDDGFVRTGDLGFVDERGRLRLSGRRSEMYVRGGYNVFPTEVEAVLAGHPAIDAVAIVPRPDEVMGEIGVAVVVSDAPPTLEELRAYGRPSLAPHKLPEALLVVAALALTAGDKLDRRALTDLVR